MNLRLLLAIIQKSMDLEMKMVIALLSLLPLMTFFSPTLPFVTLHDISRLGMELFLIETLNEIKTIIIRLTMFFADSLINKFC